jgi:acetyl esterase/lipase
MCPFTDPPAWPLWPGEPPLPLAHDRPEEVTDRPPRPGTPGPNRAVKWVSQPTLSVHQPGKPNGTAVLVCPGGAYRYLEIDKEGHEIARWLVGLGVTAFVLKYRVAPYMDPPTAQRVSEETRRVCISDGFQAMRLIRAGAAQWGVNPARIGAMGFSAGGHMTVALATLWSDPTFAFPGPLAGVSARPDFAAPIYSGGSLDMIARVDAEMPPVFMATADDDLMAAENCLRLYTALHTAKAGAELHVYRRGGHGFGLGQEGSPAAGWTVSFAAWLRDLGMLGS